MKLGISVFDKFLGVVGYRSCGISVLRHIYLMSRQFFEAYGGRSLEEAISNSVSAPYQSFMHGKSIAIGSKAGEASFKAPPMGEYMRRKAVL